MSSYNVRSLNGQSNETTYSWGPITPADAYMGTLTSKKFIVTHDYITFLIGAGYHPEETALNLLVDGEIEHSVTGINNTPWKSEYRSNTLRWQQQYFLS